MEEVHAERLNLKISLEERWQNWKVVHFKPRYKCNIKELEKKMETAKYLTGTLTIATIIVLAMNLQLFLEGKMSVFYSMLLIFSAIALYDELQNYWSLQMFLYWRERELKDGYKE